MKELTRETLEFQIDNLTDLADQYGVTIPCLANDIMSLCTNLMGYLIHIQQKDLLHDFIETQPDEIMTLIDILAKFHVKNGELEEKYFKPQGEPKWNEKIT